MTGRARQGGQALAVPATPANAVDGPSGFDPSRKPMIADRIGEKCRFTHCKGKSFRLGLCLDHWEWSNGR